MHDKCRDGRGSWGSAARDRGPGYFVFFSNANSNYCTHTITIHKRIYNKVFYFYLLWVFFFLLILIPATVLRHTHVIRVTSRVKSRESAGLVICVA